MGDDIKWMSNEYGNDGMGLMQAVWFGWIYSMGFKTEFFPLLIGWCTKVEFPAEKLSVYLGHLGGVHISDYIALLLFGSLDSMNVVIHHLTRILTHLSCS